VPRAPGFKGRLDRAARALRPVVGRVGLEPFSLRLWKKTSLGVPGQGSVRPRDLQGATVGLVGWGENARAFAERIRRAQAQVLVYSSMRRKMIFAAAGRSPCPWPRCWPPIRVVASWSH